MDHFPIYLSTKGQRIVLSGGGEAALAKLRLLLKTEAKISVYSRTKALQSSIAALGRNSAIMDASLSSSVEQSQRNMQQIGLQRYAADLQANASMMIKPKKAPAIPLPIQAPERIFIEPMKVLPQAIQPARQQSTFAPILGGLIQGASQIGMGIYNQGANNYQSPWGSFGDYSGLSGKPY